MNVLRFPQPVSDTYMERRGNGREELREQGASEPQ